MTAKNKKKLGLIGFSIIVLTLAAFLWHVKSACRMVKGLNETTNAKRRISLLDQLIQDNEVEALPEEFDLYDSDTQIGIFNAVAKDIGFITCSVVSYPIEGKGSRGTSFVFDRRGNCLLVSNDSRWSKSLNGGLLDITGDGNIEKIVYYVDDQNGDGRSPYFFRFQIFQIKKWGSDNLLDVAYNLNLRGEFSDHFLAPPQLEWKGEGEGWIIKLKNMRDDAMSVKFLWSNEEQRFVQEGPVSLQWERF